MLIAPPLSDAALKFGPPEFFSLTIMGLTLLTFLGRGSMWNSLLMASFGIFLGTIGLDPLMALPRFTFDLVELSDGIGLVPVIMGLFGVSEVLLNVEQSMDRQVFQDRIRNLLPTLKDWAESIWAIMRGTVIGFFVGVLPGGSSTISTFLSYAVEKKISKHPEKFGTGVLQGLAGPESANNAATAGGLVPLLTLGLPPNPVMAILLGAMMIHGVQPGPMLINEHPEFFWGTIASMYLGNVMLLVLNLPLIPVWIRILKVPYSILFPLILLLCLIGSYTLNNSMVDVLVMVVFGLLGYLFKKFNYEAAPLVLALVLGPIMETSLRRSLLLSSGNPMIFLTRPISGVLLMIALFLLIYPLILGVRAPRPATRKAR
jgi:putative tricarboxylic transport membrane protein